MRYHGDGTPLRGGPEAGSAGTAVHYLTALDFRSGAILWQKRVGAGINWDGYWAAPMLGSADATYFSVFGGMAALRDGR